MWPDKFSWKQNSERLQSSPSVAFLRLEVPGWHGGVSCTAESYGKPNQVKNSNRGVIKTTRPVFCLLTPHWNNSCRGQRPGVTAETPVSEQPQTTLFKCKVKEIPETHRHTQMGRLADQFYISIQTRARLLVHVQRKFISDTLGSNVKQSSLMYTKGLRLLIYIH